MRTLRLLFLAIFFVSCLSVGFLLGASQNVATAVPNEAPEPMPVAAEIPRAPNGQRNLLLLGVDDLNSAQPELQSAWLILYIPPAPSFTLLPLYPQPQPSEWGAGLAATPVLLGGDLHPALRQSLEAKNIWWHNYVVLDRSGLEQTINRWANDGLNRGADILTSLPKADRDSKGALLAQHNLLRSICYTPHGVSDYFELEGYLRSVGERLVTDMSIRQIVAEWQALISSGGRFSCEFPTLKEHLP